MATRRITAGSGRRGYYLYEFGTHLWVPETQADFSLGMFRDESRVAIPPGGVYDAADYFLHKPGVAFKRGGTSYAGPGHSSTPTYAVAYANFPGIGSQLIAVDISANVWVITAGAATQVKPAAAAFNPPREKPKLFVGGTLNVLVLTDPSGATQPSGYDGNTQVQQFYGGTTSLTLSVSASGGPGGPTSGTFKLTNPDTNVSTGTINRNDSAATIQTALTTAFGGTWVCGGGPLQTAAVTITRPSGVPLAVTANTLSGGTKNYPTLFAASTPTDVPTGTYSEVHLSRVALANSSTNPNRLWFGPLVDIQATAWDVSNAYFDFPNAITGLASLGSTLLVFMQDGFYRLDGDTPPPDTNMSERPVARVGCTDARSITVSEGRCYFANTTGVYVTTGTGADSLMKGRIESYWQSLFSGYSSSTWRISTGIYGRRFLFVTVLDNSLNLVATLSCDLDKNAWMRHTNIKAMMYASAYGVAEELYAGDANNTGRILTLSGLFSPSSSNKNDADGTAVTPLLETRPFGGAPQVFAFGHSEIAYDMRDAASDNPTLAVQYAKGVEATSYSTVAEGSPLAETSDETRTRVAVNQDSQAVSLKLQQSNASSKTEIYAVQVDTRSYPAAAGGQ